MTRNQLHGKKFEDLIKGCGLFPGASDQSRPVTAGFDIEARFDRRLGLPTSIKTTGSGIVTLSDARRFWALAGPIRMLVGSYDQLPDRKLFHTVHEFILTPANLAMLRDGVTADDVRTLHEGIGLAAYPIGRHGEARQWIKGCLATIRGRTAIILNPKIDSGAQRRLQCSIGLGRLIDLTAASGQYSLHFDSIGDIVLPVTLLGSPRQFNKP